MQEFSNTQPSEVSDRKELTRIAVHAMQSYIILGNKDMPKIAKNAFLMAEYMLLEQEKHT